MKLLPTRVSRLMSPKTADGAVLEDKAGRSSSPVSDASGAALSQRAKPKQGEAGRTRNASPGRPPQAASPSASSTSVPASPATPSLRSVSTASSFEKPKSIPPEALVQQMRHLSGEVETRRLTLKKPASPQYKFAKKLTADERTDLSNHLMQVIKGDVRADGVSPDGALQMWKAVQHARLRIHTDDQRSEYRGRQAGAVVQRGLRATVGQLPVVHPIASTLGESEAGVPAMLRKLAWITPMTAPIPVLRDNRREFYRSPLRPEYRAGFNALMDAIADPKLGDAARKDVIDTLLDQHMRTERTIAPAQVNHIVEALDGPLLQVGQTTRRLASKNDDTYRIMREVASDGYRIDDRGHAALADRWTDTAHVGPANERALTKEALALEGRPGEAQGFKPVGRFTSDNEATRCLITGKPLSYADMPVMLKPKAVTIQLVPGFYGYAALRDWVSTGGENRQGHPAGNTSERLTLENLARMAVRMDPSP